jgi:dienelactone hydrolase
MRAPPPNPASLLEKSIVRWLLSLLAAVALAVCQTAQGAADSRPDPALVTDPMTLAVQIDGAAYKLDGLMVRPREADALPLAVLTHGTCGRACRARRSPSDLRQQADVFAGWGFATFILMRRGYGNSEGPYAEDNGGCDAQNYEKAARGTADDILAAIETLKKLPYVDGRSVIAVGQSGGGIGVVALAARTPPDLKAVINFSGGRGGSCIRSGVYDETKSDDAFRAFGATTHIPTLWIYTKSDHYWGPDRPARWHKAFADAGGTAEFVHLPPIGEKGHTFFYKESSIPIWRPVVARFLKQEHLLKDAGPAK